MFIRRVHGVACIYTKGGVRGDVGVPGISDIDVAVGTDAADVGTRLHRLQRLTTCYCRLQAVFPFFKDVYSTHVETLVLFHRLKALQLGGGASNYFTSRWRCAFGIDPLATAAPSRVPAHGHRELALRRYRDLCGQCGQVLRGEPIRNTVRFAEQVRAFLVEAGAEAESADLDHAVRAASGIARSGVRFSREATTLCAVACRSIAVSQLSDEPRQASPSGSGFALSPAGSPPDGMAHAIAQLEPTARQIESVDGVDAMILSYDDAAFRFVPIVLVDQPSDSAVRSILDCDWPRGASVGSPLVFVRRAFVRDLRRLVAPHGLAEPFYLARHGYCFFGVDDALSTDVAGLRDLTGRLSDWQRIHHLGLSFPLGTNILEKTLIALRNKDVRALGYWLDVLLSYLPGRRLLLERRLIVTTPAEAWASYRTEFADEPWTEQIEQLRVARSRAVGGEDIIAWCTSELPALSRLSAELEEKLIALIQERVSCGPEAQIPLRTA